MSDQEDNDSKKHDDSDEEASALARLTDTIAARIENATLPAVQPEEVAGDAQQWFARDVLQYTIKDEAVELQSYLDECWMKFRRDNPASEDVPDRVRRANWSRDTYYPLLLEFSLQKAHETHILPYRMDEELFVPLIPLSTIQDEAKLEHARTLVGEITEDMIT